MASASQRTAAILHHYYYSRGGGGEPEYIPTDLEGLQWWFDASQLAGFSDNDMVARWPDLSGNEAHLEIAIDSAKPLYKTNVVNGLPGLLFDGSNDCLGTTLNKPEAFYFLHQASHTLFILLSIANAGVSHAFLDSSNAHVSNTNIGRHMRFNFTSSTLFFEDRIMSGTGGSAPVFFQSPASHPLTAGVHLIMITVDTANSLYRYYLDNVLVGQTSIGGAFSQSNPTVNMLFGRNNPNTQRFNGYIFEMFAYNRVLSEQEIFGLVGGLNYAA
jgi:hypothetical protein